MKTKELSFSQKARQKMKDGIDQLTKSVACTLGPNGNIVLIEQQFSPSSTLAATKDGVSVAKAIKLEDKFENIGAELVREAASKTNDVAGDGTSTSVILAQSMITEGMKLVATGISPVEIKQSINAKVKDVVKELKKLSQTVSDDPEKIKQVAKISSNNDEEIGNVISETIQEVGRDGIITIEQSQSFGIEKEITSGMQFNKGYMSPYLVTDKVKMEAVIENPYVLIIDRKLNNFNEILPLLEKVHNSPKKELLIIAEEIEGEAFQNIVINKIKGALNIIGCKAPEFGNNQKDTLADIATLTGATIISQEIGIKLENVELDMLGNAKKVISNKDKTIIIGGAGKQEEVDKRIEQVKISLDKAESRFEKEKLNRRLGNLAGGIGVIKVGGVTETEMKERRDRVEDSLAATKAAIEEGIIAGGGISLINASGAMKQLIDEGGNYTVGEKIVNNAILEAVRQIALNSGKDGSVILFNIDKEQNKQKNKNVGYNAVTDTYEDMIKAGVIDPTKVARTALQNAASVACTFLSTECIIAVKEDGKQEVNQ